MCDCRQDVEKRLTDHYAAKLGESRDVKANLTGYAFTLCAGVGIRAYMPAEISHTVTIKKTGLDKRKTEKVNMFFSHYPFCGEKLTKD